MSKIFFDTNVLVYGLDGANPAKQNAALQALLTVRQANHIGVVSTQVLQEYYYTLTRKLHVAAPTAKKEMLLLSRYQVVLLDPSLLAQAADLHATASLSFWDALIVAAAQHAACDELWTEDLQTGRSFGSLRVVNPLL
jgi:predicted nucleic acid-binding protein